MVIIDDVAYYYANCSQGSSLSMELCKDRDALAGKLLDCAIRLKKNKGRSIRIVETGETFESEAECARKIGGIQGNIHYCLSGKRHTHHGYHFEFVKEGERV